MTVQELRNNGYKVKVFVVRDGVMKSFGVNNAI
jgi:hypothetical protein